MIVQRQPVKVVNMKIVNINADCVLIIEFILHEFFK